MRSAVQCSATSLVGILGLLTALGRKVSPVDYVCVCMYASYV